MKVLKNKEEELSTVSVEVIHGDDVTLIGAEMMKLMVKEGGCGLAGNQVGITRRIIALNVPNFTGVIINPVITNKTDTTKMSSEGCLSVPGKQVKVKRNYKVTVEGFGLDWTPLKLNMKQLSAYCVQHEIDHLNGITI
tara:strand:+ start:613 stop:1026 length:414 start_codon:yes stop_codon:yes gene_type:complete